MTTFLFGQTPLKLGIPAYQFGSQGPKILILGGVHGDEIEGVIAANGLLQEFIQNYSFQLKLTLVPEFNLEGVLNRNRLNSRGVDLNRNLPSKDWSPEIATPRYHPGPSACSEPENKALVEWIEKEKPQFILSLHSYKPMINVNGDCEPEASVLAKLTKYIVTEDMGYPTPGVLGTYAGRERQIPTITYEIERGLDATSILEIHVPAILEMLKTSEKRK
jgi:murein peptide amidase A